MKKDLYTIEAGDIVLLQNRRNAVVVDYVKYVADKVYVKYRINKPVCVFDKDDPVCWQTYGNVCDTI